MRVKVCNTDTFVDLADKARVNDYNRQVDTNLVYSLDPQGIHICSMAMPHEHKAGVACELHMRTYWFVKLKGSMHPERVFLDIPVEDYDSLPEDFSSEEEEEDMGATGFDFVS